MMIVIDSCEGGKWRASKDYPFSILITLFRSRRIQLFVEIGIANVEFVWIDSNDRSWEVREVVVSIKQPSVCASASKLVTFKRSRADLP
jgi:hypothetical protein